MAPRITTAELATQIARMEAKMDARFDAIQASQGEVTNRVSVMEGDVRIIRENAAREEGKKAGSKAVLTVLVTLLSFASGVLGAYWKGGPR